MTSKLEENLQQKSVMVVPDIQAGFFDETGQAIIESVPMDDEGFGRQRGIEPAAEKGPCGQ
jgi:hypothetical protein